MKTSDIDTLPIKPVMPPETKRIRKLAPKYITSIIENTRALPSVSSIEELRPEQIDTLGGGVDGATYLVRSPQTQVVIKLSNHGVEAEAEALLAWRAQHAHVPKLLDCGIVPATANQKIKVKYLIQEAILDKNKRVAETCADYLVHTPGDARAIGRLLGKELALMHQAIASRSFGEYADGQGNTAPHKTWNAYMLGYFEAQKDYLTHLDVTSAQFHAVQKYIEATNFIGKGRYLHGDFSIRNATIRSYNPLRISLFDPNPLIGDPSWDIAILFNNYEFRKRLMQYDAKQRQLCIRDQQLVIGFKQGYTRNIDDKSMAVSQLLQAVLQARYQEARGKSKDDKLELKVRQEFVIDLINKLTKRLK